MNRTRDAALYVALALLMSAAVWAQYLGPVGSFKTPLQNQLRSHATTGHKQAAAHGVSACGGGVGLSVRDRNNMMRQPSYLPNYSITGRDMAGFAVGRGLTRGMRF